MRRPVQEDLHQINDKIRAREVRLVGENVEPGVYPLAKALEIAREQELEMEPGDVTGSLLSHDTT